MAQSQRDVGHKSSSTKQRGGKAPATTPCADAGQSRLGRLRSPRRGVGGRRLPDREMRRALRTFLNTTTMTLTFDYWYVAANMTFSLSGDPCTMTLFPTPAGTQPSPNASSNATFAPNPEQCIGRI